MIETTFNENGNKPVQLLAICSTTKHTKSENYKVKYNDIVLFVKVKEFLGLLNLNNYMRSTFYDNTA